MRLSFKYSIIFAIAAIFCLFFTYGPGIVVIVSSLPGLAFHAIVASFKTDELWIFMSFMFGIFAFFAAYWGWMERNCDKSKALKYQSERDDY